jgi:Flp pilus assembly pilin Flp
VGCIVPNAIQAAIARLSHESGQTIIEYGLVLGAISIVLVALFVAAGLTDSFQALVDSIGDLLT